MSALFTIVLPVFLALGVGYVFTRLKLISNATVDALMSYTQVVAFPILMFRAIGQFDMAADFHWPLLLSFYAGAVACFFIGMFGARALGRDGEDSVVIGFCCLFSNGMMLGVPITERAFGSSALDPNFAILAVHAPLCYTLGILSMEIVKAGGTGLRPVPLARRIVIQIFRNPLVIGILIGLAVNLTGLPIPGPVADAADLIARSAVPCALFAVGGVLVRYRIEGDWRLIGMICGLTLAVHPAVTWVLGKSLSVPADGFRSAIITAACAPGVNTYVFANLYDRGKRSAASSLLISTGVCLFTIWGWLTLLP